MWKDFGENPSAFALGYGLEIGGSELDWYCKGEAGSSSGFGESVSSASEGDLGAMGLLRISVADMR